MDPHEESSHLIAQLRTCMDIMSRNLVAQLESATTPNLPIDSEYPSRLEISAVMESLKTAERRLTKMEEKIQRRRRVLLAWHQIEYLPNELLSAIFECGSLSEPSLDSQGHPVLPFQVIVSHVSRHWREVAIRTPSLWTNVHISFERPLLQAEAYLERSKLALIDITVDFRDCIYDVAYQQAGEAMDLLDFHLDRWRRFVLKTRSRYGLAQLLSRFRDACAPNLEYLQVYTSYDDDVAVHYDFFEEHIFMSGTPQLSSLRLGGVGLPMCKSSFDSLTFLDLNFPVDLFCLSYTELREVLVACGPLQRLVLRGDIDMTVHPPFSVHPGIRLPSLRSLAMSTSDTGSFCMLLEAPTLEELDINGAWLSRAEAEHFERSFRLSSTSGPAYPMLSSLKLRQFRRRDVEGLITRPFLLAHSQITTFGLIYTNCNGLLRLMKHKISTVEGFFVMLWPNLQNLMLHAVKSHLLRDFITFRAEAGHPITNLKLARSYVSRRTRTWLREHVQLCYHRGEESDIAPDLSDVDWFTDDSEDEDEEDEEEEEDGVDASN